MSVIVLMIWIVGVLVFFIIKKVTVKVSTVIKPEPYNIN